MKKTQPKNQSILFPKGFRWGVGVCSHQHEDHHSASDWCQWSKLPSKKSNSNRYDFSPNHLEHLRQDLDRVVALGLSSYAFNFEWSKLEPQKGLWDPKVIEQYQKRIELIRQKGLTPFISLHYRTLPKWFVDLGGFTHPQAIQFYARYATLCAKELAPDCEHWLTFNCWQSIIWGGYANSFFPPASQNFELAINQYEGLLKCHAAAYQALHLHSKTTTCKVGIGLSMNIFDYCFDGLNLSQSLAQSLSHNINWSCLEAIKKGKLTIKIPFRRSIKIDLPEVTQTLDFIALNYQTRWVVSPFWLRWQYRATVALIYQQQMAQRTTDDFGHEIYPHGLYRVLLKYQKNYPWPIYIHNLGISDGEDSKRAFYIKSHLYQISRAIKQSIPVQGCYFWSLLDGTQWQTNECARFGFFSVDQNHKRYPRASSIQLKKIVQNNGYSTDLTLFENSLMA